MSYEDVNSQDIIEKFGTFIPPTIIIEGHIITEGHVPIMKKLALELYRLIEPTRS